MTNKEAIARLIAKQECMKRDTSGTDTDCISGNCDECNLCYEQGTVGEYIEALKTAISALKKQDGSDTNVGSMISRQAAIDTGGSKNEND